MANETDAPPAEAVHEVDIPAFQIVLTGTSVDVVAGQQPGIRGIVIGPFVLSLVLPVMDDAAEDLAEQLKKVQIVIAPANVQLPAGVKT